MAPSTFFGPDEAQAFQHGVPGGRPLALACLTDFTMHIITTASTSRVEEII
jgi:hypothetical protein